MSRCRSWIAVLAILTIATALAAVAAPQSADAATLKSRLRHAKLALLRSQHRLRAAESALVAAVAADPVVTAGSATDPVATPTPTPSPSTAPAAPSVTDLKAKVARARHVVRVWKVRVRRLARKYRLQRRLAYWDRHHQWKPIMRVAAAKYHVSAAGMYRMMMRESGGQQYAGSATAYKGLFQYYTGTWAASWNPWRHNNIYDGKSQIFATAYAIHKGMGPSMWTTTYASQY